MHGGLLFGAAGAELVIEINMFIFLEKQQA